MAQIKSNQISLSLYQNAAWSLLLGLVWPTALLFITTRLYVGFLGPRMYGVFAIVNSILAISGMLRLGTADAIVKYVAEYKSAGNNDELTSVVGGSLIVYLIAAIMGSVAIAISAPVVSVRVLGLTDVNLLQSIQALRIAAIGFPAILILSSSTAILAGFERYDLSTIVSALATTLSSISGIISVYLGGNVYHLILTITISNWVSCIFVTIYVWHWGQFSTVTVSNCTSGIKKVLGFGIYSSINTFATTVFNTADRIIVGIFCGAETVAYYSVAGSIASRIYTVTIALSQALLPRFSALRQEGKPHCFEVSLFRSSLALVVLFACISTGSLLTIGAPLLRIWLGQSFAGHTLTMLMVSGLAYGILAISLVPYYYLNGIGTPQLAMKWYLLAGLAEFLVMFLLAPRFGMTGILIGILLFPLIVLGSLATALKQLNGQIKNKDGLTLAIIFSIAAGGMMPLVGRLSLILLPNSLVASALIGFLIVILTIIFSLVLLKKYPLPVFEPLNTKLGQILSS